MKIYTPKHDIPISKKKSTQILFFFPLFDFLFSQSIGRRSVSQSVVNWSVSQSIAYYASLFLSQQFSQKDAQNVLCI